MRGNMGPRGGAMNRGGPMHRGNMNRGGGASMNRGGNRGHPSQVGFDNGTVTSYYPISRSLDKMSVTENTSYVLKSF